MKLLPPTLLHGILAASIGVMVSTAHAERREIIISAADLDKPEQQSDMPMPGKRWLNHEAQSWGAMNGTILMAGPPSEEKVKDGLWEATPMYRVPELVVDLHATGWYRVFIGLYRDVVDRQSTPHLQGKLSGESFPEFLQAPQNAAGRVAETYWKAADLTGKQAHLIQPMAPMRAAEVSDVEPQANWKVTKAALLSPHSIKALAKAYSGRGVASFGLYESTLHLSSPDARRAIREAGWNYDPRKK